MPDDPKPAEPTAPELPPPPFSFSGDANGGLIRHDGSHALIGTYTHDTIELDLGWCWVAGVNVKVLDNVRVDNHRGGVAFERRADA